MSGSVLLITGALDFAARHHIDQRRKGARGEPYINHLAEVAHLVAVATQGRDPELVAAALLHDSVEDTHATLEEIEREFGPEIAGLVDLVTDDKSLPKEERKRLQVESAPRKPERARMLKLADKISNLRALHSSPPHDWPKERQRAYVDWACRVAEHCTGLNDYLDEQYEQALADLR
ncbi:MAG: HD domain-containing protein [Alphaproteobacteria bacterium]